MSESTDWRVSLEASVTALAEAAREHRRAYEAAKLHADEYAFCRLREQDGRVRVTYEESPVFTGTYSLHKTALQVIREKLQDSLWALQDEYRAAAQAVAWGSVWALNSVLAGEAPEHVVLQADESTEGPGTVPPHRYLLPYQDCPKVPGYGGQDRLDAAFEAWLRCDNAASLAEHLAAQDADEGLADHESADLSDAEVTAEGLADAAYAYGAHARSCLEWLLFWAPAGVRR